jgi:hypothetical protein
MQIFFHDPPYKGVGVYVYPNAGIGFFVRDNARIASIVHAHVDFFRFK